MAGFPVQHPSYFLASLFGKGGLKRAILITFSALLLLVFSATWIFHVRGSREAVLLVTDSLALSAAERISSRLSEHLSMPAALAQANAKLIASAPVIRVESLSISFAAELAAFPDTDIVSAGFMDGEYSEAQRISDSVTRFGLAGKSTGGALELYTLNADGSRTDVKRYEGYDPRKRGWFIEGVKADKVSWSEPYEYVSTGERAIAAIQVIKKDRKTLGVSSVTVRLSALTRFFASMEEIKNGHAVIFDAKGNILLTSTSSSSFPWHLFKKPSYATRRIKSANEYWRVVSLPYGLKQDLNWMIAVALPESQFLEPLHIAQLRGGFVYFFGLVIFIILAFFLVRLITEPLRLIRLAVSDYADDSEVPLSHSPESECILKLLAVRQDELGHLAKTFLHLSLSLADSFASLNRSLKEKEIMLKEIHHRVKNNLQIVSSLLSLRAGESSNPELIEELEDVRDRVQAMALVHESIYSTGDFSAVSMDDYLTRVVHGLSAYDRSSGGVSIHLEANDINFTLEKAIPCALIVVELATNAFKHAFKGRSLGSVDVYLTKSDTGFELCVSDDGRGMMGDKKGEGMGQLIVEALCDQLKGQLILDSSERGTQIRIRFP